MNKEQLKRLEKDLWSVADNLRANSDLKASEYSTPVLGIIFLKFVDNNYKRHESSINAEFSKLKGTRREKPIQEIAIEKCGFYLPPEARYDHLLNLPEEQDLPKALKTAMSLIEEYKPELQGVLPQEEYFRLSRSEQNKLIPRQLLKNFADIPADADGDVFGQIYEYFLSEFAMSEGQGGGEFFTPRSVVRLMVEIVEPDRGTVFDPACGSGGMFVQSAKFIQKHRSGLVNAPESDFYVYGQEKTLETVKLAKMNLAVNGLRGDIKQANTYYEDPYGSFNKFDFVLANPPFNVDDVSISSVEKDRRFNTYGIPRNKSKSSKGEQRKETVPNANYLWINLFATSLKPSGRAGLVMANSASDARHSEADIRKRLIEHNLIYAMVTLPANMFYTVALPATLWFFDKAKTDDSILFIDSRNTFTQIDRAHREFSDEQIQNLALISELHRGRRDRFIAVVESYFECGMAKLMETKEHIKPISEHLVDVLASNDAKEAVTKLMHRWEHLDALEDSYRLHHASRARNQSLDTSNVHQHQLRLKFDEFFGALHESLRDIDKIVRRHERTLLQTDRDGRKPSSDRGVKSLREALGRLHDEIRNAELYHKHILWLQDRFPQAEYRDVIGLCKRCSPQEVLEQDCSLNAGRYVGVLVEEDGKSEEDFVDEVLRMNTDLEALNESARALESAISGNVRRLVGEM